jgi:hypothetical protein
MFQFIGLDIDLKLMLNRLSSLRCQLQLICERVDVGGRKWEQYGGKWTAGMARSGRLGCSAKPLDAARDSIWVVAPDVA